jgi:hypothetical protein
VALRRACVICVRLVTITGVCRIHWKVIYQCCQCQTWLSAILLSMARTDFLGMCWCVMDACSYHRCKRNCFNLSSCANLPPGCLCDDSVNSICTKITSADAVALRTSLDIAGCNVTNAFCPARVLTIGSYCPGSSTGNPSRSH